LHWETGAPLTGMVLRIHRELVAGAAAAKAAAKPDVGNGVPPPEMQVLEVDLGKGDPGLALDRDAPLDHVWKYSAERVVRVEAEKHALEMAGPASEKVTIDARDVFPPAVPGGLAAVADEEARALDLSWTPDTDADLAGYVVYRRDVTAGGAMERISGSALVVGPSFSDAKVVAGHRYAYAVSAVDADKNESARSGEVEEGLPQ
jgi:fibronectin type 3 domain-containing protein